VTSDTVRLLKMPNAVPVPAEVNTSGGGDVIVVQPTVHLAATTQYTFQVTGGLKDLSGSSFTPFSSSFTTGGTLTPTGDGGFTGSFAKTATSAPGLKGGPGYTSVVVGPDHKLYAGTNYGEIKRFPINAADGSLGPEESIMTLVNHAGPRVIIGMAFDPASTPENPILWITGNEAVLKDATEWTGVISKLSGPGLGTIEDKIIHLPRSAKDHLTNSLAFHGGKLYVTQGSNSSLGAPDAAWSQRPERLLNATVMQIDPALLPAGTLDVLTPDGGGTYNPYAANAPLKIFATGLRNAFDLVWHSNGHLYAPTNGAAGGGRAPATPAQLPASCATRPDGPYVGPAVPEVKNVGEQHDYLFDVVQGGYYGHPNAGRCEWVLNGGNPTAGADPNEIAFSPTGTALYPVGTLPDRNYRGSAYDFGLHYSTDGAIEYTSNAFDNALKGRLLIARYSSGDDIIVLTPDASGKIVASQTAIPGMSGFANPLDIAMDPQQGNLYVTEYPDPSTDARPSKITLLKATVPGTPPPPKVDPTDTTPPTIVSRTPPADGTNVSVTSDISVGFSEPMGAGSVNATSFSVAPAAGGPALTGVITPGAGNVFALNPAADLAVNTKYRVTVGIGATDVNGNALAAPESWTFTTGTKTTTTTTPTTTTDGPKVIPPDSFKKSELAFCARYPRNSAALARQMKAAKLAKAKATTAGARTAANKRIAAILKKQRAATAGFKKNRCKAIETAAFCKAYPTTSKALAKQLAAAKRARTKATTPVAKAAAAKKVAKLTKLQKAAIARHKKSCKA
jgi:hypothetical protein